MLQRFLHRIMNKPERTYIAIDLKSFYASVECVERNLDPLTTNLVVADESRTEKTICLAVSPSLKSYGIGGRARLFEVVQRVKEINYQRLRQTPYHRFTGKSTDNTQIEKHSDWAIDYLVATPRMSLYIHYSSLIYEIYLKYISEEDIHIYSIDEVFMDVTHYLDSYKTTAHQLAIKIIHDVYSQTGITATAGIGTNMYLCKVAMDIVAKHIPADKEGVRIAELNEMTYRQQLWDHKPLTSFWRVGKGIAQKLSYYGIDTMGKIARCSLEDEEFLYQLFGVNAELLIDHAWGWEPCTIDQIKAYKPTTNSISAGQVLSSAYNFQKARVVVQEMADNLSLNLVDKKLVTDQLVLTVNYDTESLTNPTIKEEYHGEIVNNYYGKPVPKHAHGTTNLNTHSSSSRLIIDAIMKLYDKIVNHNLLIRRLTLCANHVISEEKIQLIKQPIQLDLFTDYDQFKKEKEEEKEMFEKERKIQESVLSIKKRYGNNAILKGVNFEEGATAKERNTQIGGHKA